MFRDTRRSFAWHSILERLGGVVRIVRLARHLDRFYIWKVHVRHHSIFVLWATVPCRSPTECANLPPNFCKHVPPIPIHPVSTRAASDRSASQIMLSPVRPPGPLLFSNCIFSQIIPSAVRSPGSRCFFPNACISFVDNSFSKQLFFVPHNQVMR
jgi:hypothetical protein